MTVTHPEVICGLCSQPVEAHDDLGFCPDRPWVKESAEMRCTYCEGLHFGSPPNRCVYQCKSCGNDTRDDAAGYGHTKCECPAILEASWSKSTDETYPIPLSEGQEAEIKQWAADDRLWTTQETVEFNLRVFARKMLALAVEQTK